MMRRAWAVGRYLAAAAVVGDLGPAVWQIRMGLRTELVIVERRRVGRPRRYWEGNGR
jgi:hypothetical protein